MFWLWLFVSELVILFLLSRAMNRRLSRFLYRVFGSEKIVIYVLSLLYLPGTFLHEFSHLFMAAVTGVRVGEMNLVPEMLENGRIKFGSVEIEKSDPFRRALIGAAPFLVGIVVMLIMLSILSMRGLEGLGEYLLVGYVLFEIGNTTFSSRTDMEGTVELLFALAVIASLLVFGLYLLGIRIDLSFIQLPVELLRQVSYLMIFPVGVEVLVLLILVGLGLMS